MPPSTPSLAAKIAEVVLEVNNVEKDGHNDFQNYDYTSAEALLAVIRKPLASRGVVVFPKLGRVDERNVVSPKGKPSTVSTAHVTYVFVDAATGEREECPWAGSGDDPSDKGLYKAYTGAAKTFLRQTFLLPMGDDPEADTEADRRTAEGSSPAGKGSRKNGAAPLADQVKELDGTIEVLGEAKYKKLAADAKKAGINATQWGAKLTALGITGPDDFPVEKAEEVEKWISAGAGA